jgi:ABC-type multidrug transport system ATPase subunit
VIAHGEIVAEGSPPDDRRPEPTAHDDPASSSRRVPASRRRSTASRKEDGVWELRAEDPTRQLPPLTGWALERAVHLEDLEVSRPSLEDVYLEITGGEEVSA